MREDEIPPVPHDRPDVDDAWHQLWIRAHQDMAPWGRRPAPYLIDSLLNPKKRDRHWLRYRLEHIARATVEREPDHEQPDDGAIRWYVPIIDQTGVRHIVRVVFNPRKDWIFNAIPDRGTT